MATVSQRSFTGGILSPKLRARVDFNKYQSGLQECLNFIPLKQGGVTNRPGTSYVSESFDQQKKVRLIPFESGSDSNYVIEVTEDRFRIIKGEEFLTDAAINISNVTQSLGVTTVTHAGGGPLFDTNIYIVGLAGNLGNILNNRQFKMIYLTSTTFELRNVDNSLMGVLPSYTSGGQFKPIKSWDLGTGSLTEDKIFELKYAQSVNVLAITHQNGPLVFFKKTGVDTFILETNIGDNVGVAKITGIANIGAAGSTRYDYAAVAVYNNVIAVVDNLGNFTPPPPDHGYKTTTTGNATLNGANFNRIAVSTTGNVDYVSFYRKNSSGEFGFIGVAVPNTLGVASFDDIGFTPDPIKKFPEKEFIFDSSNPIGGPGPKGGGAVAFAQQRFWLGNISYALASGKTPQDVYEPETIIGSTIGQYGVFTKQQVITDDGTVKFVAANRKFNPPRHIIDLSKLVVMSENSEMVINPDGSPVTPSNVSIKTQSYNGCSNVPPIVINETALYVQAKGNVVRDLAFNFNIDGFSGNDLSMFADHLFEGYQIVDWCYQKLPNSNVWMVRSDGKVLCLTYLAEQQVLAWSEHDLAGGKARSVCSIDSTSENEVYFLVERVINGKTVKYIERMTSRFINNNLIKSVITDASAIAEERVYSGLNEIRFMDSSLVYDGRNFDTAKKIRLVTQASMTVDDLIVMQSNFAYFTAADVGNEIFLNLRDGSKIRCKIETFTSSTQVSVYPSRNVPTELNGVYTSDWEKAVNVIRGLWHLEGKNVSIFADGFVDANPLNEEFDLITVTNGAITLPKPRAFVSIGLAYHSDLKTLKIDSQQVESLINKKILLNNIHMNIFETRGLWAGIDKPKSGFTEGLTEIKQRTNEQYDMPNELQTGVQSVALDTTWTEDGQTFIRQIDPLPATILSIHPSGNIPFRGG